ncbi:hypothetical protein [Clostridium amazonitimonense]|uniref:hypothetical protein n=1 Tax=Clostridium amazonitimonense TaxID=1499689 RepID=UPI00050964B6|nr:hypothetical protein [Clostridium amazonitimonense]
MAGLNDVDIKLDMDWQLTPAANGDALLTSGIECVLQDIQCEALSQEGELFYDEEWGWSLLDFVQAQDEELTRVEMRQRIETKLSRRPEIDVESIEVSINFQSDKLLISVAFKFADSPEKYELNFTLDRVKVEVVSV